MFGLGSAFYLILFITNALAVLSEERFLARGKFLAPLAPQTTLNSLTEIISVCHAERQC